MTLGLCPGHLVFCWSQGFPTSLQTPEASGFELPPSPAPLHISSLFSVSPSLPCSEPPLLENFCSPIPWGAHYPLTLCFFTPSHPCLCFPHLADILDHFLKGSSHLCGYQLTHSQSGLESTESCWLGSRQLLQSRILAWKCAVLLRKRSKALHTALS